MCGNRRLTGAPKGVPCIPMSPVKIGPETASRSRVFAAGEENQVYSHEVVARLRVAE